MNLGLTVRGSNLNRHERHNYGTIACHRRAYESVTSWYSKISVGHATTDQPPEFVAPNIQTESYDLASHRPPIKIGVR